MEISHSSFYHGVTIGSYEKLNLIWMGWFASSKHNGPSSAKARCNLMFLRAGRMFLSPEPTCNSGHDCQGMQTAQQEHKAPSITSSNPSHRLDKQQLLLGNKAAFIAQKRRSPWPSTGLSRAGTGQSPVCPLLARPFPNRSPVSFGVQVSCLCWGHGKQGQQQLPVTPWVSGATGGIWPALLPPSCSFWELPHGIKVQAQHGGVAQWSEWGSRLLPCSVV